MPQVLPSQNWKWTPYLAIGGALVLAGLLFLLIPLTQLLDAPEKPDLTVREVRVSLLPPPPATPPLPEEVKPPEPRKPTPEMPQETPPMTLQPLDVRLSPGAGDAIAMGAPTPGLRMEVSAIAQIQELFTFDDLPEAPRLTNQPNFRYPSSLARRGIDQGKVVVEIEIAINGRATLLSIVSSTHPDFEAVARRIVSQARFTKPVINGQPQAVRGRFPIVMQN